MAFLVEEVVLAEAWRGTEHKAWRVGGTWGGKDWDSMLK